MSGLIHPVTVLRHPLGDPPPLEMRCDAPGCKTEPRWAPRLIVPPVTFQPGHGFRPLRMMLTLHYCLLHWDAHVPKVADLLDQKRRAEFEDVGRKGRDPAFKPDFDGAFVERVLVTTPEYRAFINAVAGKALWRV